MAKASIPLMKDEYSRRAVAVDRDDTEGMSRLVNVVGVSPKASSNNCLGFALGVGLFFVILLAGLAAL